MVKSLGSLEFDFDKVCMKVYALCLSLDDLETSFNQKLTKRLVTFHYSASWQQYYAYDD